MSGEEVFRVTTENAAEFCKAFGLGEPTIMEDAPDMIWTRKSVTYDEKGDAVLKEPFASTEGTLNKPT